VNFHNILAEILEPTEDTWFSRLEVAMILNVQQTLQTISVEHIKSHVQALEGVYHPERRIA